MSDQTAAAGGPRKPRIALMGEFSAGKSTLSNLLMGARPLPEKVTATRLSPVWISFGTDAPYRVDIDGSTEPVSLTQLEGIPVEETRVIRLFMEADILDVCDLIDFPGISDPNMSSEVWERMLTEVDAVIWCTHATQAWRQSEAAVWDSMPDAVRENSILLITRFDKLTTDKDRRRVFKRVRRETEGMFGGTFPISLLHALEAGEDYDKWDASGAGPFVNHMIEMIDELTKIAARTDKPLYNYADGVPAPVARAVAPRRVQRPLAGDKAERERPAADASAVNSPILRDS
ncbi:dynamin family protein [Loktanella agnita]|uniref:dynamin family protein n=1 Tax=Loktanella agnita TaxID=287097 RepID=UPI0039860169